MAKTKTFTQIDRAVVNALKENPNGLTIAQLCEITGVEVKPGHVVGAVKKNLIEVIGSCEVMRPAKRNVSLYEVVSTAELTDANGKTFNYTDNEKALLAAAANINQPFALEDLAAAMGKERLTSGSINALVNKKGNIRKLDEMRVVPTFTKKEVNVYGFVSDIPADAEIR